MVESEKGRRGAAVLRCPRARGLRLPPSGGRLRASSPSAPRNLYEDAGGGVWLSAVESRLRPPRGPGRVVPCGSTCRGERTAGGAVVYEVVR
jgi:hypothetical protein